MSRFVSTLIEQNRDLLERARKHSLMRGIADATIPEAILQRWFCYEYLWGRDFEKFLAQLAAEAPVGRQRFFCQTVLNMHGHLDLFRGLAIQAGADLELDRASFLLHSSSHYMLLAAHTRSYEESLAVCYGASLANLEAWTAANEEGAKPGIWQDLVDQRSSDSYRHWVAQVMRFIDEAAETASDEVHGKMVDLFRTALQYTLRYWDGIMQGPAW